MPAGPANFARARFVAAEAATVASAEAPEPAWWGSEPAASAWLDSESSDSAWLDSASGDFAGGD